MSNIVFFFFVLAIYNLDLAGIMSFHLISRYAICRLAKVDAKFFMCEGKVRKFIYFYSFHFLFVLLLLTTKLKKIKYSLLFL